MKKKNQKIKLSFADIKQLIAIANSLDNSHPNISDFIDDFLIEDQDQEDLLPVPIKYPKFYGLRWNIY